MNTCLIDRSSVRSLLVIASMAAPEQKLDEGPEPYTQPDPPVFSV